MTPAAARIIVGDQQDVHVQALLEHLPAGGTVVVNVLTLTERAVAVRPDRTTLLDLEGQHVSISQAHRARGWLRRIGPPGWDDGTVLGSHRAAGLSARLALLSGVLRDDSIDWLTTVDAQFRAESKIVQYRTAGQLGIAAPTTTVALARTDLVTSLGESFVAKPLGPGGYKDDTGTWQVVYARTVTPTMLAQADLGAAPFLAQQALAAKMHLRVVTVRSRAWVSSLDAADRPLDWREQETAHDSFGSDDNHPDVARNAVRLASGLQCGYSSQDWIIDEHGKAWFIDLNPAGQWLFLPSAVRDAITQELACELLGSAEPGA